MGIRNNENLIILMSISNLVSRIRILEFLEINFSQYGPPPIPFGWPASLLQNVRIKFNFAFDFISYRIGRYRKWRWKELELTGADAWNIDPERQLAVMYIVHITAEGCIKHPSLSLLAPTILYGHRLSNILRDITLTRNIFFALQTRFVRTTSYCRDIIIKSVLL